MNKRITGKELVKGDIIYREVFGNLEVVSKFDTLYRVRFEDGSIDSIHYSDDESLLVVK